MNDASEPIMWIVCNDVFIDSGNSYDGTDWLNWDGEIVVPPGTVVLSIDEPTESRHAHAICMGRHIMLVYEDIRQKLIMRLHDHL